MRIGTSILLAAVVVATSSGLAQAHASWIGQHAGEYVAQGSEE